MSNVSHQDQADKVAGMVEELVALSPEEVELLSMKYVEKMSYREIGLIVGRTPMSIQQEVKRLRKKLNSCD